MTDSLKIALIGCGKWGRNIARSLGEMGFLFAICETKNHCQITRELSQKFSVPIKSLDEILSDSQIQAVALATPTSTHYSLSKQCLEVGKNVFVEKPLVQTISENEELNQLAQEKNKVLMVGHILRYHPGYLTLKSLCDKGVLGEIQYLTTRRHNLGRFFPGESALWDLAPHDLSMILGIYKRMPSRVLCMESSFVERNVGDYAFLTLHFGENQEAHLSFSRYSPIKEQSITVHGSNGFACFDDTQPWSEKVTWFQSFVSLENGCPKIHYQPTEKIFLENQEPLKCELNAFIQAISDPKYNQSTGRDAQEILSIILAAEESIRQGQWVSLK
jgi:UDP-2-acetamido-3-amino-2,3-dideoxy-glucuronate N-acetyltransferase